MMIFIDISGMIAIFKNAKLVTELVTVERKTNPKEQNCSQDGIHESQSDSGFANVSQ